MDKLRQETKLIPVLYCLSCWAVAAFKDAVPVFDGLWQTRTKAQEALTAPPKHSLAVQCCLLSKHLW